MTPTEVLKVNDEPQVALGLEIMLRAASSDALTTANCADVALIVIADPCDLLVVDLVVPEGRGVELCEEVWRCSGVPILVWWAVGDERQNLRPLKAGAEEVLTRRFRVDERLARLRSVLPAPAEVDHRTALEVGELTINVADGQVALGGEDMHLDPLEVALVRTLAEHRGRLVTDRQLLRATWGRPCGQRTRELRVLVAAIRGKLERDPARPEYLIAEPGVGDRLRDRRPWAHQAAVT